MLHQTVGGWRFLGCSAEPGSVEPCRVTSAQIMFVLNIISNVIDEMTGLTVFLPQVAGCDFTRSPGEAGLCKPPSEPQTARPVPEKALPAAQHPGWRPAGHHRVSEPVQT